MASDELLIDDSREESEEPPEQDMKQPSNEMKSSSDSSAKSLKVPHSGDEILNHGGGFISKRQDSWIEDKDDG